jgi:parallel beta-helix repeat protein
LIVTLLALALSVSDLRSDLARGTGAVELPSGETHLDRPLEIPPHTKRLTLRGHPTGSTLVLDPGFKGRAAIVVNGAFEVTLEGFTIRGDRTELKSDWYLPEHSEPFADFYTANGIVVRASDRVVVRGVKFASIRAFPILVNASSRVLIESVDIRDSGTLNRAGRNNTTGGILLEEGVAGFQIRHSRVANITGNAIWTHSYSQSPRSTDGFIIGNTISTVARDAIQVGHAARVRVENNIGSEIGFPAEYVDVEHSAVAVALDTAGNVDHSLYVNNRFTDVNGQCIDLDGFHDGEVTGNSCLNSKGIGAYPALHYGIVFGNNDPGATSSGIVVTGNTLSGFAYGGVFLAGSRNRIENNRFTNLNLAHCGSTPVPARCAYYPDQPDMLCSGVYIAGNGGRPAPAVDNIVRNNLFSGFGIPGHCVTAAPGVRLDRNVISGNTCEELPRR